MLQSTEATTSPSNTVPTQQVERIIVSAPPVNVQVLVPEKKSSMFDVGAYAPAFPGILVALFGIWAAHALAQRRDRKKSISDLCESLKKITGDATIASIDAWLEPKAAKRASGIASTKRLLQSAGITATTLQRRTRARQSWGIVAKKSFWPPRLFEKRSIDLIREVTNLRQVAMADPFEDPTRGADASRSDAINAAASSLVATADRALFDYQG